MVNISTGHKAKSADLARARGKGMGTTLVAAREQAVRNYPHKTWSHLQESVFVFCKLAFSLVNSFAVSVLGAIPCETDQILFQKV